MFKKHKYTIKGNKKGEALFVRLIHFENSIDYNKLLYISGNQKNLNFYEFASLVDLHPRLANDRIILKKADLKVDNAQITILMNIKTFKYYYVIRKKKLLIILSSYTRCKN